MCQESNKGKLQNGMLFTLNSILLPSFKTNIRVTICGHFFVELVIVIHAYKFVVHDVTLVFVIYFGGNAHNKTSQMS